MDLENKRYNGIHMSRTDSRQSGMVAIMVTMIMILIISLIVLGFAQVTRRNQREALDNQLSTQAYYAAESGVNVADRFFQANPMAQLNTTGNCTKFMTDASPSGLGYTPGQNVLNQGNNTAFTCLMVNSIPPSLAVAPLAQGKSTVWHLQSSTGGNFGSLKFSWSSKDANFGGNSNDCVSATLPAGKFPQANKWKCTFGILRIDLVTGGANITNSSLEAGNLLRTIYVWPDNTVSSTVGLSTNPALTTGSSCNYAVNSCSVILGLNSLDSPELYARLTVLYQDAASASVTDGNPGAGINFINGQAIIDATGKAQDELRRLQVRIPLMQESTILPNFAISSTDPICKQLNVSSGAGNYFNGCP